jgi:hypothetical protein
MVCKVVFPNMLKYGYKILIALFKTKQKYGGVFSFSRTKDLHNIKFILTYNNKTYHSRCKMSHNIWLKLFKGWVKEDLT